MPIIEDVIFAIREAKNYVPDYPWPEPTTITEAVWALGQSVKGTSLACDDLHKTIAQMVHALRAVRNQGLHGELDGGISVSYLVEKAIKLVPEEYAKDFQPSDTD